MIKCMICGKEFIRITPSHLVRHKISIFEYKENFGFDSICSLENKQRLGHTLESMVKKYGEDEGRTRWDEYRRKQKESNLYEYKSEKHGWTKDQFESYNKSRAITLDNMIKKHGKIVGKEKFEEYCLKQAYAGTAKEYFIEKYGEELGIEKYNKICYDKGSSARGKHIPSKRRGMKLSRDHKMNIRIGTLKYLESLHGQLFPRYNPSACREIEKFGEEIGVNFQHAENGGEILLEIGYWVDGYNREKNIVVEYFEPWHKRFVEKDLNRLNEIIDYLGCEVYIIRENDDGSKEVENYKGGKD